MTPETINEPRIQIGMECPTQANEQFYEMSDSRDVLNLWTSTIRDSVRLTFFDYNDRTRINELAKLLSEIASIKRHTCLVATWNNQQTIRAKACESYLKARNWTVYSRGVLYYATNGWQEPAEPARWLFEPFVPYPCARLVTYGIENGAFEKLLGADCLLEATNRPLSAVMSASAIEAIARHSACIVYRLFSDRGVPGCVCVGDSSLTELSVDTIWPSATVYRNQEAAEAWRINFRL